MKYLIHLILFTFLFHAAKLQAQGEANFWYFGQNAGLDFNSGAPVAITNGEINTSEGSAVISDANGQLLFYTDGATVWNRNHDTLQNGFGLLGELSSTQAALIIPKPGSNSIYYIFTTSQAQRFANWNFCYTEVDMSLDGGLGGVTANKNIILFQPIGEKITAVKHSNNIDIWVITHAKNTNAYLTYAVTSSGVNATPIIFNGGTIDNGVGDGYTSPNWGYIKASPDGSKIAAAFSVVNRTDVLDFNKTTGQLSFRFTINQIVNPYGVEFSPNSSLLYVSSYSSQFINQYNLALATPAAILSSSNILLTSYNGNNAIGLQLGPDEKIYTASGGFVGAFSNPNQLGIACNFISNAVSLNDRSASLGLPNFFPYFFIPSGIEHIGSCPNDSIFFTFLNGAQVDSVRWNFDDPNSGISNTSTSLSPFHFYQNPGTYIVSVTTFQGSVINTVTKPVTILPIPDISIGDDTTFCQGTSLNLDLTQANVTYLWQDGSTNPVFNVTETGTYSVFLSNQCGFATDTTFITANPLPTVSLGPDTTTCAGNPILLDAAGVADAYSWQDGTTNSSLIVNSTGLYSVMAFNNCGVAADTISVNFGAATESSIILTECQPFVINEITYSSSGEFTQLLQNATGCDSILTINAEIINLNAQISQTENTLYLIGTSNSIQWINCTTGLAILGATQTSFTPQVSGNYGVIITNDECSDTSNCRQIIKSSIPQKPATLCDNLIVTPNPVTDQLEFTLDKSVYDIRLFTSTGAIVISTIGNSQKQIINFQDLAPALYVLQVDSCKFKIVKQ